MNNMTQKLGEGKVLPLVFKLTIPAVVAQLITFLYNVVDRMYVANIKDCGMDALAALGIVLPITLIMLSFSNLIGLGGSARAGIKLGEGNNDEANKIFNVSAVLLTVIGVFLRGLQAHSHSDTLPPTRPHLLIVPLPGPSIFKPSQRSSTVPPTKLV